MNRVIQTKSAENKTIITKVCFLIILRKFSDGVAIYHHQPKISAVCSKRPFIRPLPDGSDLKTDAFLRLENDIIDDSLRLKNEITKSVLRFKTTIANLSYVKDRTKMAI